jgi:hypothetical protein
MPLARHSAMVLGTLVLLIYFAVLVMQQYREHPTTSRTYYFPLAPARAARGGEGN